MRFAWTVPTGSRRPAPGSHAQRLPAEVVNQRSGAGRLARAALMFRRPGAVGASLPVGCILVGPFVDRHDLGVPAPFRGGHAREAARDNRYRSPRAPPVKVGVQWHPQTSHENGREGANARCCSAGGSSRHRVYAPFPKLRKLRSDDLGDLRDARRHLDQRRPCRRSPRRRSCRSPRCRRRSRSPVACR